MNVFEHVKLAEEHVTTETKNNNDPQVGDLIALAQILEEGLTSFSIPTPDPGRRAAAFLTGVGFRHSLTALDLALRGNYNASLNILRLVALQTMLANYYGVRAKKALAYMEGPRVDVLRRKLQKLLKKMGRRPLLRQKLESALEAIGEGLIPVAEGIIEWYEKRLIASTGERPLIKTLLKNDFKRGDTPLFSKLEKLTNAEELDHIALKRLHVDVHARFFNVMEAVEISGDQLDPTPHFDAEGWHLCAVSLLYWMWKVFALTAALIPATDAGDEWRRRAQDTWNNAMDRYGKAVGFTSPQA